MERFRSAMVVLFSFVFLLLAGSQNLNAQTATGSILGTVTDQSGAAVAGANVTIKSTATGTTRSIVTTETGSYSAIALQPGIYLITYEVQGFGKGQQSVTVAVGVTANGDFVMPLASQDIKVVISSDPTLAINTAQAVVEDVLTGKQIDELPLNGRNFLDLAQLNAGVQMQDGGNLDPTKQGFAGISLQGRSGRSTRIEVDGVDVTDDTVGTTTINLSEESIQEFQVAQSTLDPANSVTTSGAVNVITRSGSNDIHGSGFYLYRNNSMSARINGIDAPFNRSLVGFRVGGPAIKNRLFWFLNYEHTLQHGATFAQPGSPFTQFGGAFPVPFHETLATARVDWNLSNAWRAFYAFHFDQMNLITGFGGISFQPFANRNYNATHTFGLDGTTGRFTHSFRVGVLNYRNYISDARSSVAGLPEPFPGGEQAGIAIGNGNDPLCTLGTNLICLGPNYLVSQITLQHNQEVRYDGSIPVRNSHTLRYGGEFIHIPEFTFASFFANGPMLNSVVTGNPTDPNPLNYPLTSVVFGNGLGFDSEKPGLGFPHGGFSGKRFGAYVADFWKVKPNVTVTAALRYNRIAGRTDSDANGLPSLESLIPGASHAPNQPNNNLAPQLGVAWDPFKDGKTSVRAGAGIFWDNFLVENLIFDRPLRIPGGLANITPNVTGAVPGTNISIASLIGQPIGSVVDQVVAAQAAYQAANAAAAKNFNASGTPGFNDPNVFNLNTVFGALTPNLKMPRSVSMNIGVQRQLKRSMFVSVDYIRNVATHSLMNYDVNQVGAASSLNAAAAQVAIATTAAQFGCSGAASPIDCTIANGATIKNFAANGLGSPANGLLTQVITPNSGFAFAGRNSSLGQIMLSDTIGRSVYNALQARVKQDVKTPFRGVRQLSWQAIYNLSRFNSTEPDQDVVFAQNARDNLNPLHYFGPNALDRTHMFTFAGTFDIVGGLRLSLITRIYSALPATLTQPLKCSCPAEIFFTDLTGDGTGGDLLPGTNVGAFGRSVKAGGLNNVIGNFNSSVAGTLTPASQALVNAGLFTQTQLQQLGAVVPSIALAPAGQVGLDNFVADDLRLSYSFHAAHVWHGFGERTVLEPTVDIYNVVNKANFDPPGGFITAPLRGVLDGTVGSANGTTASQRFDRYGLGSGVFSQGVPRALEIGMRLTF